MKAFAVMDANKKYIDNAGSGKCHIEKLKPYDLEPFEGELLVITETQKQADDYVKNLEGLKVVEIIILQKI